MTEVVPTVIAHGDIRNNLLQHGFALDELLVLGFCSLQFCAKFLCITMMPIVKDLNPDQRTEIAHLNLSTLKELGILTCLGHSTQGRTPAADGSSDRLRLKRPFRTWNQIK
jgi:hypothetical protein